MMKEAVKKENDVAAVVVVVVYSSHSHSAQFVLGTIRYEVEG